MTSVGEGSRDLLVVALSGVQQFISESRSTVDLGASSAIMSELAVTAADALRRSGVELIFPAPGAPRSSAPNRIVGLAGAGQGPAAAAGAAAAVIARWQGWVRQIHQGAVGTPGMPSVQWVVAPPLDATGRPVAYGDQWRAGQSELAARKRINDFPLVQATNVQLCSLSPRWPAVAAPSGLRDYEKDTLSAANWVKRRWNRLNPPAEGAAEESRFSSTAAIATASYRQRIIDRLDVDRDLAGQVAALRAAAGEPGRRLERPVAGLRWNRSEELHTWVARGAGSWLYTSAWDPGRLERDHPGTPWSTAAATAGSQACKAIAKALTGTFPSGPPAYLAVVTQDVDDMGRLLSGTGREQEVNAVWHTRISQTLAAAAAEQRRVLDSAELLTSVVYAGGDDLFALAPAATALTAARVGRTTVPEELGTASSAVLFFHYRSSLQRAVVAARRLLEDAKSFTARKDALGVGFLRRSGAAETSVHPWDLRGTPASDLFASFGSPAVRSFSPRAIGDLSRDERELADLDASDPDLYRAEIGRLIGRHLRERGDPGGVLNTLLSLTGGVAGVRHAAMIKAMTVGQFIGQECR
ncbi:MAG TPA: type III-B CRISPR-associated protein Cas10/Cmr2 [Mycobacterium sp.]